ncbi:lipoprotein [Sporocytophaga myxococcoides]|uniref:Lipoprotein n=1 Tax=Sporocytophaga myxococcoides TaxID=153721 RepID=A0A098LCL8_9BACT|nr:C40 family peptidase [Sporocytophaga myxococcoides]GAL83768.1 lipoprotein [Sporocytophaga myxococcoides]
MHFFKVIKSIVKPILFSTIFAVAMVSCKPSKHNTSGKNSQSETKVIKTGKPSEDKAQQVINSARSYLGTHYKYGGTTKSGIDCSGLVCNSFKTIDITLPRTSTAQSEYGKSVKIGDVREGDLLFFSDNKGGNKINHVGLVTEVKSNSVKFIHSTTKMGVIEDDLYSDYYHPRFVKAIRIIN